ncbi:formylglycine-generating enzyme family protein [Streptococcus sp. X16XC17]|nr:formylglycine-generating enzyme family protein [Streptococcus sp. X16XC17]
MILIKGGRFLMGTNDHLGFQDDLEGPTTEVHVADFYMDKTTVTNRDFLTFFQDTGYVTDAERFGFSYVFHLLLSDEQKKARLAAGSTWWYEVADASWRMPEGPGSSIAECMDHPVVHVSYHDAYHYAKWAGKRLPLESEWEYACRGGKEGLIFPWGNELTQDNQFHANTWQGDFPIKNSADDGFIGTAPAKWYEPNGYGLYQMIENVWEWCLNSGRIPLQEFATKSSQEFIQESQEIIPSHADSLRALREGVYLCHISSCARYRNAGRNSNTALSSTSNTGFRCVRDVN